MDAILLRSLSVILLFLIAANTSSCSENPSSTDNKRDNNPETVEDIDGNIYPVIKLGDQFWMAENLRTSRFRNGDPIEPASGSQSASVWYNNKEPENKAYGKLYNFYAVTDSRGLCTAGWKVPSDEEWQELERTLGMTEEDVINRNTLFSSRGSDQNVGGKLKATGTDDWDSPNTGATDELNFSALPAGIEDRGFWQKGQSASFWTSSQSSNIYAIYRSIRHNETGINWRFYHRTQKISVRCILD
jgi:uncharacterized protein (TIGR02145 family)